MKKSLAAVTVAAALAFGGVAFTGGTASAACPYTGCVNVVIAPTLPDKVPAGKKVKVKFSITASGNVVPTGTVKVVIKSKSGFKFAKSKSYKGGTLKIKTSKLVKKGKYTVKIKFTPTAGSIYNPSVATDTVRVR